MNREEVLKDMITFASRAYKTDASQLNENTNLNDLGVASLQRVAMSASIEDEYDVSIPVARFCQFESIVALVDYVMEEAE